LRKGEKMVAKRILILTNDPGDGKDIAIRLSQEGYSAQAFRPDSRQLPGPGTSKPDLVIVYFSPHMQWALDLAHAPLGMRGVPILVVSALSLSQLEGPLRILPIVSGVLFTPYSRASLLDAVERVLRDPASDPVDLAGVNAS
jgi:hypothetical protein